MESPTRRYGVAMVALVIGASGLADRVDAQSTRNRPSIPVVRYSAPQIPIRRVAPLEGTWDVDVVAAHREAPDGTISPIMSKGVFTFTVEQDSLVVRMQVALSPTGRVSRLATRTAGDTAVFVRRGETVQASKGDRNTLGMIPIETTFRFVAVGDSLHGSMQSVSNGTKTEWPIAGVRRKP